MGPPRRRRAELGRLTCMLAALGVAAAGPASAASDESVACPVTVPGRPSASGGGARAFSYGGHRLRVHIYWPGGTLPAGMLPDGGSMATVAQDGSIHAKVGWWRGGPGRLRITGRRLDGPASALHAHVPAGYGARGFQPSGIVFPTPGCWRVVGTSGDARLAFVVRVTTLPPP